MLMSYFRVFVYLCHAHRRAAAACGQACAGVRGVHRLLFLFRKVNGLSADLYSRGLVTFLLVPTFIMMIDQYAVLF